ncbi:MAG: hypothetical protein ACLPX5_12055 [Dissulfurispiraceae bacterium]
MFDKFCNGYCPECAMKGVVSELWLNEGDLYECPNCNILVCLESDWRATILRRRGNGNFKSREDKYYAGTKRIRGLYLCKEDTAHRLMPDNSSEGLLSTQKQFEQYLQEIIGKEEVS